jgi:hypothetical protein
MIPNVMARKGERGYDTEVAAAAAKRPKEVLMRVLAGGDEAAISQHDIGSEQVVDGEAEPS